MLLFFVSGNRVKGQPGHDLSGRVNENFRYLAHFINDNDAFKFQNGTDKYYSYGLFFKFQIEQLQQTKLSRYLPIDHNSETKYFIASELYLKGFTPEHNLDSLVPGSRPFAGILALRGQMHAVNSARYVRIAVELGVRGPASGAEFIQNEWHRIADKPLFPGWKHQLPNQILANVYGTIAFPFRLTRHMELLSESELALGNHNAYFQQGLIMRIGFFHNIASSSYYKAHGSASGKKEIYATTRVFFRGVIGDATLSESDSRNIGLIQFDRDDHISGFEVKLHLQSVRYGLQLGYAKRSSDSNFTVRHSYGTIGFSVLL